MTIWLAVYGLIFGILGLGVLFTLIGELPDGSNRPLAVNAWIVLGLVLLGVFLISASAMCIGASALIE